MVAAGRPARASMGGTGHAMIATQGKHRAIHVHTGNMVPSENPSSTSIGYTVPVVTSYLERLLFGLMVLAPLRLRGAHIVIHSK